MVPNKKASEMTVRELAAYIDQSVLKPQFTESEIRKYIQEGIDFGCRTVCINPSSLDIASDLCEGSETKICVVCDFPFGLSTTAVKASMASAYCKRGDVFELDIVANYGWILSGFWDRVLNDIRKTCDACHSYGVAVKVILETDALSLDQVLAATDIVIEAGADFVKTSTGFYTGGVSVGAAPELVRAIIARVNGRCKVKGSGSIRTREHFFTLIDMGIDRMGIGYSSTPVVLQCTPEEAARLRQS